MILAKPNRKHNADRAELATKMRLIKLQHSTDPTAAAIASGLTLVLAKLDRLLAAGGAA